MSLEVIKVVFNSHFSKYNSDIIDNSCEEVYNKVMDFSKYNSDIIDNSCEEVYNKVMDFSKYNSNIIDNSCEEVYNNVMGIVESSQQEREIKQLKCAYGERSCFYREQFF